jgi:hypothetical protein
MDKPLAMLDATLEVESSVVPPLIAAPEMVVPLTSSGSEKATPIALVLGIAFSCG